MANSNDLFGSSNVTSLECGLGVGSELLIRRQKSESTSGRSKNPALLERDLGEIPPRKPS
jgi:hypothetical protein